MDVCVWGGGHAHVWVLGFRVPSMDVCGGGGACACVGFRV